MALIQCPSCSQQISDKATICPNCSLNVHEYNAKKQEEDRQRQLSEEQARKKAAEEAAALAKAKIKPECPECHGEVSSENEICPHCGFPLNDKDAVARAEEYNKTIQSLSNGTSITAFIGIFSVAIISTALTIWSFSASEHGSLGLLMVFFFFIALGAWGLFFALISEDMKRDEKLRLAKRDYAKYKEQEKLEAKAMAAKAIQQQKKWETEHPVCPNCGKRNTRRITTTGRAVSVATVGLASSKIGKQYECIDCKHKW